MTKSVAAPQTMAPVAIGFIATIRENSWIFSNQIVAPMPETDKLGGSIPDSTKGRNPRRT